MPGFDIQFNNKTTHLSKIKYRSHEKKKNKHCKTTQFNRKEDKINRIERRKEANPRLRDGE